MLRVLAQDWKCDVVFTVPAAYHASFVVIVMKRPAASGLSSSRRKDQGATPSSHTTSMLIVSVGLVHQGHVTIYHWRLLTFPPIVFRGSLSESAREQLTRHGASHGSIVGTLFLLLYLPP
jgi:hypothetical protein